MKTIKANVTDTNHRPRGVKRIRVAFDETGPYLVQHQARTYFYTNKAGTNHKTGLAVREMATDEDSRLWITLDGTQIWED